MAASKPIQKVTKAVAPLRIKVQFLTDCDPGNGKPVFKKGSVKELVISSANHWVRRGKAVKYTEPPKKVKVKAPKPRGRQRKTPVKAEPVVTEYMTEKAPLAEEKLDDEPDPEGKKTEDGESFGGMGDLMD